MAGSFASGRFRFQVAHLFGYKVDGSDWESDLAPGFRDDLQDDDFGCRLTNTGKIPALDGAPVASWVLARLARLTDDRLGLASVVDIDGGGYVVEFVVYRLPAPPANQKPGFVSPRPGREGGRVHFWRLPREKLGNAAARLSFGIFQRAEKF